MNQKIFIKIFLFAAIATLLVAIGCFILTRNTEKAKQNQKPPSTEENSKNVEYKNEQYGFKFTLPSSWKGYSIITSEWEGYVPDNSQGDMITEKGLLLSIRHPKWTSENPRQDIPIMVFTVSQWSSLQEGKFHIGAAPINPSELSHNSVYVFALPARYNYAFLTGYEEVESILQSNPLQTF